MPEPTDRRAIHPPLSEADEARFRAWAREHYTYPDVGVDPMWHPVIRDECAKIEAEATGVAEW